MKKLKPWLIVLALVVVGTLWPVREGPSCRLMFLPAFALRSIKPASKLFPLLKTVTRAL